MTAALQTLAKFRRLADAHKVDKVLAAATSAIREADNGGDVIAAAILAPGKGLDAAVFAEAVLDDVFVECVGVRRVFQNELLELLAF